MDKQNAIKTQEMWKDYPNTAKWIEAVKNPQKHGFSGVPDGDYLKAVESLEHILLGN